MITTVLHLVDTRFGNTLSKFNSPYRVHAMQRASLVAIFGGNEVIQQAAALYDVVGLGRMNGFVFEDPVFDREVKEVLKRADAQGFQLRWSEWCFNTIMSAESCDQTTALLNVSLTTERVSNECRVFYSAFRSPRDELYKLAYFADDLIRSLKQNSRVNGKRPEVATLRTRDAITELACWTNRLTALTRSDVTTAIR